MHGSHADLHAHAPDDAVLTAVDALRAVGERITAARLAVIERLAVEHDPVTAEIVVDALAAGTPPVHRATVYRTLERLVDLGIVTKMRTAGDAAAFHLAVAPPGHEHLHARCLVCGRTVVLPPNALGDSVARLARARLFRLEPAQSDLVGRCSDCVRG